MGPRFWNCRDTRVEYRGYYEVLSSKRQKSTQKYSSLRYSLDIEQRQNNNCVDLCLLLESIVMRALLNKLKNNIKNSRTLTLSVFFPHYISIYIMWTEHLLALLRVCSNLLKNDNHDGLDFEQQQKIFYFLKYVKKNGPKLVRLLLMICKLLRATIPDIKRYK